VVEEVEEEEDVEGEEGDDDEVMVEEDEDDGEEVVEEGDDDGKHKNNSVWCVCACACAHVELNACCNKMGILYSPVELVECLF
jgi:hypothetical protein